ncbi:hypothetical protein EON79_11160 [bacterium]|nr:MAG: hypothetical protein EON79_11160 [bacterium]
MGGPWFVDLDSQIPSPQTMLPIDFSSFGPEFLHPACIFADRASLAAQWREMSRLRISSLLLVASALLPTLASAHTVVLFCKNNYGQANAPTGLVATQVGGGTSHSLALRSNGTVVAWGQNYYGQCDVPTGLTSAVQVSERKHHTAALAAAAHCVLDQAEVHAGDSATGTVKLAHPAPAMVTIPAGSQSATVSIPLGSIAITKFVRITAEKPGSSLYRTLKIAP